MDLGILFSNKKKDLSADYREETVKIPLLVTFVVLLLICAPLLWMILKINEEGAKSTSVAKYNALVEIVNFDVDTVDTMLSADSSLNDLSSDGKAPVVTLIVPEVMLVDESSLSSGAMTPLNIQLDAIYWSPANPIVGIGEETYRVGDSLQGYEIIEIGKTKVRFRARDGSIVVKDFYENLLQSTKK